MADAPVTGSIHEIDAYITQLQLVLSMSSRPNPLRPLLVCDMGSIRLRRHGLSNQREDLDKAIDHFTELILLVPHLWLQHRPIIYYALYSLANTLVLRSKMAQRPEDAIHATKYLFHLRDQPHEIPCISRHKVRIGATASLVQALSLQVEFGAGNVMQNIREMAVLSRELILETPDIDPTYIIRLVHEVAVSKIRSYDPDLPRDELIEFLRAARKRKPELLECRTGLAVSLVSRYWITSANGDYEEAMSILDEIRQDISVVAAQTATRFATFLANMRSMAHGTPEYLEEAIYRNHTHFGSSSSAEINPPFVLDPEASAKARFRFFGSIEGVKGSTTDDLRLTLPSRIITDMDGTVEKLEDLFFEICNNDDMTKIDEAIEKGRSILGSAPDGSILDLFGALLYRTFQRTKKIEHLNESISARRQVIATPLPRVMHLRTFSYLSLGLLARAVRFPGYRMQDLDEGLDLLSQYVTNAHGNFPDRYQRASLWAMLARSFQHPSVSSAYEAAMSLIPGVLLLSPTLQLQHNTLAMHAITHSLPLDYASYRVGRHQLEEAIETLERARALLWSEMRQLRVSIDQLVEADPDLGHKFSAVNQDLEELTKSVPPSHVLSTDDSAADNVRAVDPFGRLLLKQRSLLEERDKLISQIQALPNFDSFLAPSSFNTLRSVASSGPVIIVNHSIWRSDILILLHNMPPSLIPTSHDFYPRASALRDKMLDSRREHGLDSKEYDVALAFVLAELYNLVGQPVIDRLRQLQVPEQSRIWWYPTSVFCALPLHAMGPIPSDDGELHYFLDLYICSYTPTLSALIQSRHRGTGSRSLDRPSILLVADLSLPNVSAEIQVVQALDTEVTTLISEAATPAMVIDGFHHHRFVHFACHGELEAGKPFEAGFELHGDVRLTLLEIVRARLPTAEFAFLSACHTAEVTEGSIMDEGLHLAAAVQYCGFRSVVGTMWAMADEDGRDLAKNFYKALLSNSRQDEGIPYHERSAEALRSAVKKLREKRQITLERWVNFVHYGA